MPNRWSKYDDLPISQSEQDLYGVEPFVVSLARSIKEMSAPRGVVIAINGPWGSGKSSVMNLLSNELNADERLHVLSFNPWWFRGEEALVLAFFRELYAATKPSVPERAWKVIPKLGARLLKAGGVVAPAADALGAGGAGAIAAGAMDWLGGLIEDGESVEKLHEELANALANQDKRFVVLVDDIDRLSPEEALAMFRLVKSVGRLPNVTYVLAFDRILAERVVGERYPSEGPHYLEKIVQASFEVPPPDQDDLKDVLRQAVFEICGTPDERLGVHFMNLFHDILAPEIRSPRDVVRYINALSVTWPGVAGEVDPGDFMALEAIRIFRPAIYVSIRSNAALLTGVASSSERGGRPSAQRLDDILLSSVDQKNHYRTRLMRMFAKLQAYWENTYYAGGAEWNRMRRACSLDHFSTYFRLSPGPQVYRQAEMQRLRDAVGDAGSVKEVVREASGQSQRDGSTRIPVLLDAIVAHASEFTLEQAGTILTALFDIADEIDLEQDEAKAFSVGGNFLRLHWLLRALLMERTDIETRTRILLEALTNASVGWLADFASSAWKDYHPREGADPVPVERRLVTEDAAGDLRRSTFEKLSGAASDGSLLRHRSLAYLLFRWRDFSDDQGEAVRRWTAEVMESDDGAGTLAGALIGSSWQTSLGLAGLGDRVARRVDRVSLHGLDSVMDSEVFRRRVEELAGQSGRDDSAALLARRFQQALLRTRREDD